jgi:hypothetical protein
MTFKYQQFRGGLDLKTSSIDANAGSCVEATNYYENLNGGYTRIGGYERFSGQIAPSSSAYYIVEVSDWNMRVSTFYSGNVITLGGFDVVILAVRESVSGTKASLIVTQPNGELPEPSDESPLVFDTNCSITSIAFRATEDKALDLYYMMLSADYYRSLIAPIEGVNVIRGVHQIGNNQLAWRDSEDASLRCFSATPTGWQPVQTTTLVAISVTNLAKLRDTLNSGLFRVAGVYPYLPDGLLTPDATKAVLALTGSPTMSLALTRDSDSEEIGSIIEIIPFTRAAGGRIEAINHNFYADAESYRTYFCDGLNPASEYMPDLNCINVICQDYRKPTEAPVIGHIIAHNSRLFLATKTTFLTTVTGEPTNIDGFLGSQEIGAGDTITGFKQSSTELLVVLTKRQTLALSGTGSTSWKLVVVSPDSGCLPYGAQSIDEVFTFDDRGINALRRTEVLGGFAASSITENITPLFNALKSTFTASCKVREMNQVRFFSGSRFLMLSRIASEKGGFRYSITEGQYPNEVECLSSDEDATGKERIFFGSDDGYVYECEKGISFDGQEIESVLSPHFNHLGTPYLRKRYRSVEVMLKAISLITLEMFVRMDDYNKSFLPRDIQIDGEAGLSDYDAALFDIGEYNNYPDTSKRRQIVGTGRNIQLSFYNKSFSKPFSITGYILEYTKRGLKPD